MRVPARAFFNWVGSLARKSTSLAAKSCKGDTFNEVVAGSKQRILVDGYARWGFA